MCIGWNVNSVVSLILGLVIIIFVNIALIKNDSRKSIKFERTILKMIVLNTVMLMVVYMVFVFFNVTFSFC